MFPDEEIPCILYTTGHNNEKQESADIYVKVAKFGIVKAAL